jgi:osmoprotectant transport system substrate-binding protein
LTANGPAGGQADRAPSGDGAAQPARRRRGWKTWAAATGGVGAAVALAIYLIVPPAKTSNLPPGGARGQSQGSLPATGAASASAASTLSDRGPVGSAVVGSADFPESEVIAEVYALALQAKGVKVTTKFGIGARQVYYSQVENGAVSVIPEYNGALLTAEANPASTAKTTAAVDADLAAKLPSSLTVLNPAPAQDNDSVTVTAATAARYHLKTIADLKPYASGFVLGGPLDFKTRPDGIAGLEARYGLTFKGFDPLDESGPGTLAALTSGQVQAADVFTTTPQVISDKLVCLADPEFKLRRREHHPARLQARPDPDDHHDAERGRRQADHTGRAATGRRRHRQRQLRRRGPELPEYRRPRLIRG